MPTNSITLKLVPWPYMKIQNPQTFIPSSGTRHRPVKTKTSIQGEHVQKKKQKKKTVKKLAI